MKGAINVLFGNKEQRDLVLETAKNYADSIGVTLIFGAMVSSVSKNCHYPDSDVFVFERGFSKSDICAFQ